MTAMLCVAAALAPGVGRAAAAPVPTVSFRADVAPLLQRRCVACHGPEKAKGRFRLDTFAGLMKPGSSDESTVVPGRVEASHLFQLITEKNADDRMPQNAEPLPAAEIAVIRGWIATGAVFDGPGPEAALVIFLPRPAHPPAPARYAHPWPVTALAFSPDGSQLAAGGCREILLFNPSAPDAPRRMGGMPERVRALAWQPGGGLLAVAGGEPGRSGEVLLLDPSGKLPLVGLAQSGDEILCAAFSPDGRLLAAGGSDKTLRLFSVKSGAETLRIEQHSDWVHATAFSPDGRWFASASRDRTARVCNTTNGETASIFRGHDAAVEFLAFSADGRTVLSAGADRVVRGWESEQPEHVRVAAKFEAAITGFTRGGDAVFVALADGRVFQRGVRKGGAERDFMGMNDRVTALAVDNASRRLAAGSHGGRVRIWSLENGALLSDFSASPGFTTVAGK